MLPRWEVGRLRVSPHSWAVGLVLRRQGDNSVQSKEQRRIWRAERTARGICQSCTSPIIRGSVLCHEHKQKVKRPPAERHATYVAKKAQGGCIQCGVAVEGRVTCVDCSIGNQSRRAPSTARYERNLTDLRVSLYGIQHLDRRQSKNRSGGLAWALTEHRLRMEAE